jgi:TrmH family RNA methyltransferase
VPIIDNLMLPQIGLQHPRIKQVRQVINNSAPNHRRLCATEGLWAHQVLLEIGSPVDLFLWCPESAHSPAAPDVARAIAGRATQAFRVSQRVLDVVCEREKPDGMLSLVALPQWEPDELVFGDRAVVLVADGIEIPGNLGTMLRTVDACGADAVLLTNRRTRLSHPKVFRGSRGMNLRIPVVEFATTVAALSWLTQRGFHTYLAAFGPAAVDYRTIEFGRQSAIVVGNERYGIAPQWRTHGLDQVVVPMRGMADSLNVSVSASILLYAATEQSPVSSGALRGIRYQQRSPVATPMAEE